MLTMMMSILFVFFLLGLPMVVPMVIAPVAVLVTYFPHLDMFLATQQLVGGLGSFVLLAIPMFILAAEIMCAGECANRLLDMVEAFVGHIHGGLSITTAATCTLFGAISGSTQATVVAVGRPMKQRLIEAGNEESDTLALIISSAIIALLIPPSVCMIMYCVVTGSSVGNLFIAGILPGLLILLFFAVYNFFYARYKKIPITPKQTWAYRLKAVKRGLLPLGFPVIIFAGIYTGVFSPTEAAAVSVLYAFVLEFMVYRSITLKMLHRLAINTAVTTAAIFILIAAGSVFSWCISYAKLPQEIVGPLLGTNPSALTILILVTLFFFVGCMFVDAMVVIYIITPIFFPVAMSAGIDPIHLGVVVVLQSAIGCVTPPFGCNIFTACAIFNRSFSVVVKRMWPYILMLAVISGLVVYFPGISTFLIPH